MKNWMREPCGIYGGSAILSPMEVRARGVFRKWLPTGYGNDARYVRACEIWDRVIGDTIWMDSA